jgi:hypothetical protein
MMPKRWEAKKRKEASYNEKGKEGIYVRTKSLRKL